MKKFLLYLWQLPQNLVGLILTLFYKFDSTVVHKDKIIRICHNFPGGISLGDYIFVSKKNWNTIRHEYGHSVQSKYLGPLYLIVIGLPSIIWAGLYGTKLFPYTKNGYYVFYSEKWADKLGEVNRK